MRNTVADVVAAALRVLDAHGLEGCSMRRVAAELDVQPSALYHHVPNKQSLLARMADVIVGGVLEGDAAGAGVGANAHAHAAASDVDRARSTCVSMRGAMLAVRDGADVVATAAAFRLGSSAVERRLAEWVGTDGARALLFYTFGQAQSTQTHRQAASLGALIDAGERHAGFGSRAPADPEVSLDASFERGLDIIIAGLGAGNGKQLASTNDILHG